MADGPKDVGVTPRLITPGGFYYILADQFESLIVSKVGQNGEVRVPFDVYIESANAKKHVVKLLLFVQVKDGNVAVHTQTLSIIQSDW